MLTETDSQLNETKQDYPEKDSHNHAQLIFDKGVKKKNFNGEKRDFSINGAGTTGHAWAKTKQNKIIYLSHFLLTQIINHTIYDHNYITQIN